jgi:hypothetical protein
MGLSFTIAVGPRQRSHSQVLVTTFYCLRFETLPTWRARSPYLYPLVGTGLSDYTPSHWVPFSSPPTTRRATVEAFDPASTRDRYDYDKESRFLFSTADLVENSQRY